MGGITGLIFLTKTEVFLAEFISLALCLSVAFKMENLPRKILIQKFALFAGTFMIFPLLFFLYFSTHMALGQAFLSILSPWTYMANESLRALPFFQKILGIDEATHNLTRMAFFTILFIACFMLLFFLNHLLKDRPKQAWSFAVLVSFVILGFASYQDFSWIELPRPLPLFMVIIFLTCNLKQRLYPSNLTFLCLTLFSFLLMLKMILNVHVYHYGFVLALPATLVFIKAILDELSELSSKVSGSSAFIKTVSLTLVLFYSLPHIWVSYNYYRLKTFKVGDGLDTIYTYDPSFHTRGKIVRSTLEFIKENTVSDASFTAFPDSVMFNYLLRRKNPGKFTFYGPAEWILFGDNQALGSIKKDPPTYILLTQRNSEEFGYKTFGKDYGKTLYSWILKNYTQIKLIGKHPSGATGYGIQIMKKRSL